MKPQHLSAEVGWLMEVTLCKRIYCRLPGLCSYVFPGVGGGGGDLALAEGNLQ